MKKERFITIETPGICRSIGSIKTPIKKPFKVKESLLLRIVRERHTIKEYSFDKEKGYTYIRDLNIDNIHKLNEETEVVVIEEKKEDIEVVETKEEVIEDKKEELEEVEVVKTEEVETKEEVIEDKKEETEVVETTTPKKKYTPRKKYNKNRFS